MRQERNKAQAAEEERRKLHEERIEKALSKFSPEQKEKITVRARREVEKNLKGSMSGRTPKSLVNAQVKKIISQEYLNEPNQEGDKSTS
jgi:hypothetical protein